MRTTLGLVILLGIATASSGAVTSSTQHSTDVGGLNSQIASADIVAGAIPAVLAGDQGWHPANTSTADQLPAFTDGAGILGSGLTGLLNDFPDPLGSPVKRVQFDLSGPTTIGDIQILTGSNSSDGRVLSTFRILTSTNGGTSFDPLGYFESDPLGTINNDAVNAFKSTLVTVSDNASPILADGVTNLQFEFFAVDNGQGQYRDPFDGVNPFTGIDDFLTAAFVSPLVLEIDVNAVPEPSTLLIVGLAIVGCAFRSTRKIDELPAIRK